MGNLLIVLLARLVSTHPRIVAVGGILVSLLAVYGKHFDDRSPRIWRRDDDPDRLLLSDVRRDFELGETDAILVVDSEELFTARTVAALREMGK